ncbi:MAG: hypothetical protein ACRD1U_07430 [Vicinamibacterales bacterium]
MGFKDVFRRVLHPPPTEGVAVPSGEPAVLGSREWAAAWLDAFEDGRLQPPKDVHDAPAWDAYWTNHVKFGPAEQGFSDMTSSDNTLIDLLASRDARTILCAGNGLSTEALSLAMHGFHVTALDISKVPSTVLVAALSSLEQSASRISGMRVTPERIVFGEPGCAIPADVCPPIHRTPHRLPQGGGSLASVTGDLIDPAICPGPFDAVIERRTVQLFPEVEREVALDRLASRLGARGLFVSHFHDGCGGPGRWRPHYATGWVASRGFVLGREAEAEALRLALLVHTSG